MALHPQVNQTAVAGMVTELWGCLVLPRPGLDCQLVQRLTATSGAPAQHYVGILHTLTADSQVGDRSCWHTTRTVFTGVKHRTMPDGRSSIS
jgi:hypothetical protein